MRGALIPGLYIVELWILGNEVIWNLFLRILRNF